MPPKTEEKQKKVPPVNVYPTNLSEDLMKVPREAQEITFRKLPDEVFNAKRVVLELRTHFYKIFLYFLERSEK
jgi:hypothetical protein